MSTPMQPKDGAQSSLPLCWASFVAEASCTILLAGAYREHTGVPSSKSRFMPKLSPVQHRQCSAQEANALVPDATDTLCLAAKAWSDLCYLDEIEGPCREPLSTADKQAVNRRAMQYAQQVPPRPCPLMFSRLAVVRAVFCAEVQKHTSGVQGKRTCRKQWAGTRWKVHSLRAGDQPVAGQGAASRGVLHQHGPPGGVLGQQDEGGFVNLLLLFTFPCILVTQ